ncbi:histidinol-phosphatase HisJ family protein [Virgibacillus necropolis]|uniref:Histidinol-phosphatase n=1 Tax=Virgibacillus necropolis TaxID=163877 RepID=A0A221MHQ9_9BACI|nr:histidinol-phosphatase HisJ family protein [Virgibacillus necropolis]ASN07176.1 histidinol-phosphatase [Virgibacillus necropolis]
MFDYHVHSNFSADCSTPMERSIERAIELGLHEICFTEHIDYEYPDPTIDFDLDLPSYAKKIKQLQQKYQNLITIKKGVELGVQPYLLDRYDQLMKQESFDFVICSMHTADKKDLHSGDFFKGKSQVEAYETYYQELLYCVKNYHAYSILGHIDLVKRYQAEPANHDFTDIISAIFKEIISTGKGIELNTSGVRYGLTNGMPSTDILKLYFDMGGEIITLGSDSHSEQTISFQFKESLELLKQIGFRYIATFDNQSPTFHAIK